MLPKELLATILITVHPDLVSKDVPKIVDVVVGLGPDADQVFSAYSEAVGIDRPEGSTPHCRRQRRLGLRPHRARTRDARLGGGTAALVLDADGVCWTLTAPVASIQD
ncbi:hypothetical protein [Aminobacter sp. Piv2-1]|uniref:hypothetical protein n=1 Tax=Aminobacter sp. Piv2-1 TaxID=3031122 RepID=UPI00309C540E